MNFATTLTLAGISISLLAACDRSKKDPTDLQTATNSTATQADLPLMPVTRGDTWIYDVRLEIPANATAAGAPAVNQSHQRTRTYLGKISPAKGLPEVDCLEITVPGSPTECEFVEIHDDRILMRGSMIQGPEYPRPMWLDPPVPFVHAGMKVGTESPEIRATGGGLLRKTQVVGREAITVPAGTFQTIRLLMTGTDGGLELKRTIWFAPGTGIVREEKTRYRQGKLIFRETQQLAKTSVNGRPPILPK